MSASQMPQVELECGCRNGAGDEEEEHSVCFSDADEGSCNSNFYSTADGDGSYDDYAFGCGSEILEDEVVESTRASSSSSSAADDPCDLEIGCCVGEKKDELGGKVDRDCRICHLSLVSSSPGAGIAIELGCSCKDDLAAAHKHCADTWFKIKGNKTCEICNSIASNVVGPSDTESAQQVVGEGRAASASSSGGTATEAQTCLNGHRFLNFLLACMVFAFVISWLFHFNIPS